ncbi:MAG: D-alanyl-D-alanine carboxypeptidase [Clostridia bacterium]|nr:D-alanyl-D-alanine carboxypeptidase [Clostridia bacterium]
MLALAALLIFCIVQEKNFQEGPVYDYERYYGRVIINKSEVENLPGDDLSLYASASVAIDYRDGHILYGDEENIQLPMASTTKILTAIIALENASGDEIVTISKNAANSPKVRLGVKEGEQYYLKDLLLSMMLGSHNDSAVAIAEHLAGSTEAFSKMMNEKAHELGVKNSSFVTPNGLDAENHYSTAYDMAVIGSYAIQNDEFVKLINTSQHSFSEINNKSSHNVTNINSYLSIDDTAIGIKTGFTGKAGYCFVGANTYEDTIVVSCVLACGWPPDKNYKWNDMKSLMNMVRENYYDISVEFPEYTLDLPVTTETNRSIIVNGFNLNILHSEDESVTQVICVKPYQKEYETATDNNAIGNSDMSQIDFFLKQSKNEGVKIGNYEVEEYLYYGNVKRVINNEIRIN